MRKPLPKPIGTSLPHDWRDQVPTWRIDLMMARVETEDYLCEVRKFEAHHLAAGTLSDNWVKTWKDWCRARLSNQNAVAKQIVTSLFSDI